jgi:peroxiredoxin
MRPGIDIGAAFPDYELPDQTGTKLKLSDLQGIDPMIVILSRGHYSPKDRRQHRHLVDFYPEVKVGYARLVTISTMSNSLRNSGAKAGDLVIVKRQSNGPEWANRHRVRQQ